MYKTIFIGTINRSGGSLLARLFDGHPEVLSYPTEFGFPFGRDFYEIFESYAGVPMTIPRYERNSDMDVFGALEIPREKPKAILKWGKEKTDPLGVRKNYIEKVFYDKVKTDFDFSRFINSFNEYKKNAKHIAELYDARHRAYFEAWDNGRHMQNPKYVIMHDSGGFYMTNIDTYFKEFEGALFVYPIRDVMGYIASEKTRLARRYYGSRRFSYPRFPNFMVKGFNQYDLEAQIRAWMVSITRGVLLQEKYGVNNKFVVYGYSNLLNDTERCMRGLCEKIGLEHHPILLEPTIASQPWAGNSHQGKSKGVNKELDSYYPKVLTRNEMDRIEKATRPIREFLSGSKETPLDLTKLPKKVLLDYNYQKKYIDDEEKITLYYALVNTGRRRLMVKTPPGYSFVAYLYSKMIQLIHMPRMLKLKFFPGWGKQNYT